MTHSDPAATSPPAPAEPWPAEDLSSLLHDFGDEVNITPEIRGDHVELIARPRTVRPVATASTPAALRAALIAKGYVPWPRK